MKKVVNILIIITLIFFGKEISINAKELNCSTILKEGSSGSDVRVLQSLLNKKENCNLEVDGSFGTLTAECVKKYQIHYNLGVDGIVGNETCTSLNKSNEDSVVIKYKHNKIKKAVVNVDEANVRARPTINSRKIGSVKLGNIVRIISQNEEWYKIKGNNKKIGYIKKELVSKNCIIVDISKQKLIVYNNGNKDWSTNIVTGNKDNHDTPVGSYTLSPSNFMEDEYLKGTNDDGSSYSAHVDYWMPFINEIGIGFHDASWRTVDEFNPETYKGNGSHGCVNMQQLAAEKLFNSIQKDTTVIVRK